MHRKDFGLRSPSAMARFVSAAVEESPLTQSSCREYPVLARWSGVTRAAFLYSISVSLNFPC